MAGGRLSAAAAAALTTVVAVALTSCAQSSAEPSSAQAGIPAASSGVAGGEPTGADVDPNLGSSPLGTSPGVTNSSAPPYVDPGTVLNRDRGFPRRMLRLPGDQHLPAAVRGARVSGPVTIVQANLYTGMTSTAFAADLSTVVSGLPDVVTLNETYRRTPAQLRPAGYDEYRAEAPRDARETPVLWRTDRWERVDAGTFFMHSRRVKWGTRYVNWVTLQEKETGGRISVISGHASPGGPGRDGLLQVFLARLDVLAAELHDRGPVFVGSDLNTFYERSAFLRTSFPQSGLVSTYDALGEPQGGWATGDGGRTIDYVFTVGALPQRHSVTPLAGSDHRMLSVTVEVLPPL